MAQAEGPCWWLSQKGRALLVAQAEEPCWWPKRKGLVGGPSRRASLVTQAEEPRWWPKQKGPCWWPKQKGLVGVPGRRALLVDQPERAGLEGVGNVLGMFWECFGHVFADFLASKRSIRKKKKRRASNCLDTRACSQGHRRAGQIP